MEQEGSDHSILFKLQSDFKINVSFWWETGCVCVGGVGGGVTLNWVAVTRGSTVISRPIWTFPSLSLVLHNSVTFSAALIILMPWQREQVELHYYRRVYWCPNLWENLNLAKHQSNTWEQLISVSRNLSRWFGCSLSLSPSLNGPLANAWHKF